MVQKISKGLHLKAFPRLHLMLFEFLILNFTYQCAYLFLHLAC